MSGPDDLDDLDTYIGEQMREDEMFRLAYETLATRNKPQED